MYKSRFGRTVLEADNVWFTLLTLYTNPIHFDAHYAAQTEWERPLVDSTFTLALVTGLSVVDVRERAVNLGWKEVRLPAPVFAGDTIRAATEILAKRESASRPGVGRRRSRSGWAARADRRDADHARQGAVTGRRAPAGRLAGADNRPS